MVKEKKKKVAKEVTETEKKIEEIREKSVTKPLNLVEVVNFENRSFLSNINELYYAIGDPTVELKDRKNLVERIWEFKERVVTNKAFLDEVTRLSQF